MIGIDWGTSNFRAFRIDPDGTIRERRSAPLGVLHLPDRRFAETLSEEVGDWLATGDDRVLLCGMIGSRQGWREAPYVPCPAGIADLARAVVTVPFAGASVRLVPGISTAERDAVPDLIRGEETKIVGIRAALGAAGLAVLPGTHSKWVRTEGERIADFATYMTGELFALLQQHSILGRMLRAGATDWAAFDLGLARSADRESLLHHLFGVRTLTLAGRFGETEAASYLSGLLIGHEVRSALERTGKPEAVHLLGAPGLSAQYARAIGSLGTTVRQEDADAAARGLAAIAAAIDWSA